MRKIFTERHLVVALFIIAFVVFAFASEDARIIEARNFQAAGTKSPAALPLAAGDNGSPSSAARD